MVPTIYYCFDAYCGWCYGFSKVMTQIAEEYKDRLFFDVLSGGMIFDEIANGFRNSDHNHSGIDAQV